MLCSPSFNDALVVNVSVLVPSAHHSRRLTGFGILGARDRAGIGIIEISRLRAARKRGPICHVTEAVCIFGIRVPGGVVIRRDSPGVIIRRGKPCGFAA